MNKFGFIGMGNMAQAIAIGMVESGLIKSSDIMAYAPNQTKLKNNADKIGFTPVKSLKELIERSNILIMACKPYQIESVLSEAGDSLKDKVLVSIAAGWDYERYSKYLSDETRVQFVMPNTPAMVKEGVFIFESTNSLNTEERQLLENIFGSMGMVVEIDSEHMNAAMAIAGCGPAYVDLVIEALGDAGVKYGLTRQTSYKLASQMILGAAKLQIETGEHPGVLKDNVCSPGGTTIAGVDALEHGGIRATFIDAIDAVMNK